MSVRTNRQTRTVEPAQPSLAAAAARALARNVVPAAGAASLLALRAAMAASGFALTKVSAAVEARAVAMAEQPRPITATSLTSAIHAAQTASATQAEHALAELIATAAQQATVVQTLTDACARAAAVVGFPRVTTQVTASNGIQVLALDPLGRTALATEIRIGESGPEVETETVGITDGTCEAMLERFDAALEAEGVTFLPPGQRWRTGGVPTSAAARFAGELIKQPTAPAATTDTRTQRRRQSQHQSQRLS